MPTSLHEIHQHGVPPKGMLRLESIREFRHTLELKYPAPEYKPSRERLLQLLIDKRTPEPVLKAASLGLPARRTGVV
jgi:hypothetical protein